MNYCDVLNMVEDRWIIKCDLCDKPDDGSFSTWDSAPPVGYAMFCSECEKDMPACDKRFFEIAEKAWAKFRKDHPQWHLDT